MSSQRIGGTVVTVDAFGNLITNIGRELIPDGDAQVLVAGHALAMHHTYGNVTPGTLLALVNSFDVIEIACAEGNAAERLGLGRGAPVTLAPAPAPVTDA